MTCGPCPEVSVIVPCYNAATFLGQTLESILTQQGPALEIILVDDGSTDDSIEVAREIDDDRIRIISIPASGGPSRPRNIAIAEARGRLIFFCDADDVMLPGKIDKQSDVFAREKEVGLVFTDFMVIDRLGHVLSSSFLTDRKYSWHKRVVAEGAKSGGALDKDLMARALLHGNFIGTSSVAVRREVLADHGGFDESLASSEDADLWLRLARNIGFAFLNLAGHCYRRHGASLMAEVSVRHPQARIEVLKRQLDRKLRASERQAIIKKIARNECAIGYIHELNGRYSSARQHYYASLRHSLLLAAVWGWLKAQTLGRLDGLAELLRGKPL